MVKWKSSVQWAALTAGAGAIALALGLGGVFGPAFALNEPEVEVVEGDPAVGEELWSRCQTCHQIGEGAENGVGPQLNEIMGRVAGSIEGFNYGSGLAAAAEQGFEWNEERIFGYLGNPRNYIRDVFEDNSLRARMAFRLRKEEDRWNVIAYLKTFSTAAEEEAEAAPAEGEGAGEEAGEAAAE